MGRQTTTRQTKDEQAIIEIVRSLPPERVTQIADFARFIQWQSTGEDAGDRLDEGTAEEEIRADEARWDAQSAASRDQLRALVAEAREEIRAGRTRAMTFTKDGRVAAE
jgi:hypothetical protein